MALSERPSLGWGPSPVPGSQGLSFWLQAAASHAHHSGYPTHQGTLRPSCFSILFLKASPTSVLKRLLPQGADLLFSRHLPSTLMSPPFLSSPGLAGFQMLNLTPPHWGDITPSVRLPPPLLLCLAFAVDTSILLPLSKLLTSLELSSGVHSFPLGPRPTPSIQQ